MHLDTQIHDEGFGGLFIGKHLPNPFYMDLVGRLADLTAAGTLAAVNMIIHTGAFPFPKDPALPQGKQLVDTGQEGIHCMDLGKRAEVLGGILYNMPSLEHPGKGLSRDPDDRIGLAIPEVNVVFRGMLFDECVFQEQRFVLIRHDDGFDASGMA
jgi:hypothetical protein